MAMDAAENTDSKRAIRRQLVIFRWQVADGIIMSFRYDVAG
jgi:hypothetical protein